jgi:prevent-host-death family protein
MNIKTTLPISEARKKIFEITKDVQKPFRYYTLTEKGRPKAVVMSAEDFESWMETLEVMRDFPYLEKDIKETNRDIKTGAYKRYSSLEDVLIKNGYLIADRSSKKYGISGNYKAKGRKRAGKNSRQR